MSIQEYLSNVKTSTRDRILRHGGDILLIVLICLSVLGGFGLGLMTGQGNPEEGAGAALITSFQPELKSSTSSPADLARPPSPAASSNGGRVYASKSGTRYYYEHCSGIKRIKPENLVSFSTIAEAEARGLTLAVNCHPR